VLATITAFVAVPAVPAVAATRGASECLNKFDDYYSEGWDRDVVTSATTSDGTTVTLHCGNEMSGVIHIAHDESIDNAEALPSY
jgi:hypothetical protein